MLLELIVALGIGILLGIITGLAPGIHINLVSVLIVSVASQVPFFSVLSLSIGIAALAVTHTMIDFIPAVYLGAPEEDTFLAVLPGHELLREGKGHEAVVLALYGSLAAIPILLVFIPLTVYLAPKVEHLLVPFLPFLLIFICMYMILREEKIVAALVVFVLAGFLGFATLHLPVREPLFPLLTGLFGTSGILMSLKNKESITKQLITPLRNIRLSSKEIASTIAGAAVIAPPCSLLPALGSGYASLITAEISKQTRKGFLFLVGIMNMIVMVLSFPIIYALGKSRTGAAAAINELLGKITLSQLSIILGASTFTIIVVFFLGVYLSKLCVFYINRINYSKLSLLVLVALVSLTLIFSNMLGLLVLVTATALGVFAISSGIKRIHLMGSLLVPTILYYLFLS